MDPTQQKTIGVPVSGRLAKQLQENEKMTELEKQRRRTVYDAICELSESATVDVDVLFERCSVLDTVSWNEVVEERFLGRVCGLPTCSNGIQVNSKKEYVIDRGMKAVFATTSEFSKYCSSKCHHISRALQSQLDPVPIWSQKERQLRQFSLPNDVSVSTAESISSKPALVERMEELTIADHLPVRTGMVTDREAEGEELRGEDGETDSEEAMHLVGWIKQENKPR